MEYVTEPQKQVPCACDVDVVVAGAGISGIIAAMAAARKGAATVLVDRFGAPGGNIGPGCIVGGSLTGWPGKHIVGGITGIHEELLERHAAHGGGSVPPFSAAHHFKDANIASYVATKMLVESGVALMLSAYVADPIMAGTRARGLFVENKSGRQAIKARVVIDATGEADVARRAGAPIYYPRIDIKEKGRPMGIRFLVAGVDWSRHDAMDRQERDATIEAAFEKGRESGEYTLARDVGDLCTLQSFSYEPYAARAEGMASGYVGVNWPDRANQGDGEHISRLEVAMRAFCHESAAFWRAHVPGFEQSYMLIVAPFLGSRGGPSIDGETVLTQEDVDRGGRFDDVMFISPNMKVDPPTFLDIPYRVMLPRQIDGVLATGRSASRRPGSLLRSRAVMMHMGQAGGTAAALAARGGATPRDLDVRLLQRTLLDDGFHLGDVDRLRELGVV